MAPNGYGKPDESGIRASLQRSVSLGFNQASALGSIKDVTFYANQVNILDNMYKKPDLSIEELVAQEINDRLKCIVGWSVSDKSARVLELGHYQKYAPNLGKEWIVKVNINYPDSDTACRGIRSLFPNLINQTTKFLFFVNGRPCSVDVSAGVISAPAMDDHGKYYLHTPERFLAISLDPNSNPFQSKRGFY